MTREEEILSYLEDINPKEIASHIEQGTLDQWAKAWKAAAGEIVVSALRPVSRETVEKVWPGCDACKNASLAIGEVQFYGSFEGSIDVSGNIHYCPNCGRPITPVAKERQVERLEALKDGKGD